MNPVGIPKLDWHELFRTSDDEIFADSERLMQKYSILADTLGELSSPAYSQVDLASRVARAQYELFFACEGQSRLLKLCGFFYRRTTLPICFALMRKHILLHRKIIGKRSRPARLGCQKFQ